MTIKPRHFAAGIVVVLLLLALFTLFQNPAQRGVSSPNDLAYSQFLVEVEAGRVRDVVIYGPEIHGTFNDGRGTFQTYAPNDPTLVPRLFGKGVMITARSLQDNVPWFVSLLMSWLPFIVLIVVWVVLSRRQGTKS